MSVIAYPREAPEMAPDARNKAFSFFGGAPRQAVRDNLKTAADAVLPGRERKFNRRFMAPANRCLFEPAACAPASGREKGLAENQAGNARERLFTPRA